MKRNIICLGLGPNQLKLIKHLDNEFNIIGIDRHLTFEAKKIISKYYVSSIYDLKKIKKISKKIKDQKIDIEYIIYRSSGPTILSANLIEREFNIKRISLALRDCIYSKSFFYQYLNKFKIEALKSKKILKYSEINIQNSVIKPDAPIIGKKNIFKIGKNSNLLNFNLCKKESHNNRVNLSQFYYGPDISTFYLVNKRLNKITLLSHIEEFNEFKKNRIHSYGSCVPPIYKDKLNIKKKRKN